MTREAMGFTDILDKYEQNGHFTFMPHQNLAEQCNAPDDKAGIYVIYKIDNDLKTVLYIGSSGQRGKDGKLKVRKGGLNDRLINGYHPNQFGEPGRIKRKKAFPIHMTKVGIAKIEIHWWVTYYDNHFDFPTDVEKRLTSKYLEKHPRLPEWHKQ